MSLFLVNLYNQDAELRKQEIENRSLTENVIEYIDQHYADPLTIDQLAEQFFVSKYHLMHEFSQKTGTSFYRYLMQQRLSELGFLTAEKFDEVFHPEQMA